MKYKLQLTVLTVVMMACGACSVVSEKDKPQEVLNKAMQAQRDANSYRARMTASFPDHQYAATLEYVKPDRYHMIEDVKEYIFIGEDTYIGKSGGKWSKVPITGGSMILGFYRGRYSFPGKTWVVKFVGKDTLDGQQMLVYQYAEPPGTGSFIGNPKIWISPRDGLPRKVEDDDHTVPKCTITYSDYNSGIKIEPPL
jgi:outer membrane lipoprotein-sorting protein